MVILNKWTAPKILIVNLVILFIAFELIGNILFYIKNNEIFYAKSNIKTPLNLTEMKVLSPYFGYSYQANRINKHKHSNNYGFISTSKDIKQYPYKKQNKNEIVIGIFGGSVAQEFVLNKDLLKGELKKYSQFKNKQITILQFAVGGYKQPQQLLVYSYFLSLGQEFDIIINLDGFNEMFISAYNIADEYPFYMPASFIYKRKSIDLTNGNNLSKKTMAELAINKCLFSTCYLFQNIKKNIYNFKFKSADKKYYQQKLTNNNIFYNFLEVKDDFCSNIKHKDCFVKKEIYIKSIKNWEMSSLQMKNLSVANNIKYIHVVQPNQYYRKFSKDKFDISSYKDRLEYYAVKTSYPLLLNKYKELKKSKFPILNLTSIFDNVKSEDLKSVYRDECCHFTKKGNSLMAKEIAEFIIQNQ